MRVYINRFTNLARTQTARDTYTLFTGNVASAFLGFVFTLVVARQLSVAEFGIFSAAVNLIIIITSLTDIGISSGIVNFVSTLFADKRIKEAHEYIKAGFLIRTVIILVLSAFIFLFAPWVSRTFLATDDPSVALWAGLISLGMLSYVFFPFVLQAQRRFLAAISIDLSLMFSRMVFTFVFLFAGGVTLNNAFIAYFAAGVFSILVGFYFVGISFLNTKPKADIYSQLLRFSGWLGVNRIVSAISGRLDVQMLAILAGATATGFYSIPSRLASFVVVLASSFSSVLAPRLASFADKDRERTYLLKATFALFPIVAAIVVWIIFAEPFILLLFGEKYLPAVPVFQALTASMIPFLFTVPSVSAIVYSMKKPVYIGTFSFFQLASIFLLNLAFIPQFGPLGPTITFGIVNSILAIYSWVIVIRYYWAKPKDL